MEYLLHIMKVRNTLKVLKTVKRVSTPVYVRIRGFFAEKRRGKDIPALKQRRDKYFFVEIKEGEMTFPKYKTELAITFLRA